MKAPQSDPGLRELMGLSLLACGGGAININFDRTLISLLAWPSSKSPVRSAAGIPESRAFAKLTR